MKSAIILGGGAAGCQCALWLKLLGHEPFILEKTDKLGGLLTTSPYLNEWIVGLTQKTGIQIATNIQEHILSLNIPIEFNSSVSQIHTNEESITVQNKNTLIEANFLVIATGVRPKRDILIPSTNVLVGPGEQVFNYDFKDQRVAILGGGDNAAENYLSIQQENPKVCHIYAKKIKARRNLWSQVDPNHVHLGSYEIDQALMSIWFANRHQEYDVFVVMYGWEANLSCAFNKYRHRLLNNEGYINTDSSCRTAVPRFFAIGEVTNRSHPSLATAIGDGVIAAKVIQAELET